MHKSYKVVQAKKRHQNKIQCITNDNIIKLAEMMVDFIMTTAEPGTWTTFKFDTNT